MFARLWSYVRESAVLLALIAGGMVIQGGYYAEFGCGCNSGISEPPHLRLLN